MEAKALAYAGPIRDGWQRPAAVIDALHLQSGTSVADIGAGGGYFTFRLANAVGDQGRVYAVDTDQDMIAMSLRQPGDTA
jgi:arsenite methyltransferase